MRHTSRKSDYKQRKLSHRERKINTPDQDQGQFQDHHQGQPQGHHQGHCPDLIKKRTKTEHGKSRVKKHKHRLSSKSRSSSRSSSRSNARSSHKKSVKTRRAKSKVHKHKRHSSSSSESQSRSRSRSRSHRTKTRSKETKRKSQKHSDSDTDSSVDRCSRHGNPRKHPKALRFDGKTNWLSFKKKFDSYRKEMRWSEKESKDYLMWSLEGKALDFLTITKIDLEKYSFRKIMKKLETRFGVIEFD